VGVTLAWRDQPDKDNRAFGASVTFGGLSDRGTGYMAYSDRVGPGVLIVHDAFGLSRSLVALADEFRGAGFTVLCPDLHGTDERSARAQLRAAAAHLTDNWHPRLGIVGFSIGADLAAALAEEVEPSAVVLFYAHASLSAGLLGTPVQAHLGAVDPEIDGAVAASFDDLEDGEMYVYEGVGHDFADRERDGYAAEPARLAMQRTLDFLRYHLS
jgi:carboxymethylenebutenolidase